MLTHTNMLYQKKIFGLVKYGIIVLMMTMISPTYAWQKSILDNAQEQQITSRHTGKTYRIQVSKIGQATHYPTLYVLDGERYFAPAAISAETLLFSPNTQHTTAMLIVGISYADNVATDRADDLTVNRVQFARFLDEELTPILTKIAPIDEQRTALFGHSYAGLFTTYRLLNTPQKYQYFIISSPSIWWNNQAIWHDWSDQWQHYPAGVWISAGNLEKPKTDDVRRQSRAMIDNAQTLSQRLKILGVEASFTLYDNEDHGSVAFRALHDALKHLRQAWKD